MCGALPQAFFETGELDPAFLTFAKNIKSVKMLQSSLEKVDFGGGRQSDLIRLRALIAASVEKVASMFGHAMIGPPRE